MEQTQAGPGTAAQKEPAAFSQLMNVYVAPGEVFEHIKSAPRKNALWGIPITLTIIIGIISTFLIFSNDAIVSQLREQAERGVQQAIDSGRIPPDQADRAREQAAGWVTGPFGKVMGIGSVVVFTFAGLLLVSLAMLLIGKIAFKATVPYGKVMEVVGASFMTNYVLGSIVTLLVMLAMGSLYATPGLALLISGFDPSNKVHLLLSAVNIFSIWYLAVLSIGVGKVFGGTTGKAGVWVVGLWVAWTLITTFALTFLRMA
jgi:hypothetical protein